MCLGNSSHILFCHHAISGHFLRWPHKKLVGTISYYPLYGFHSNFISGSLVISDDLIKFGEEFIKNKMADKKACGLVGSHLNLTWWFSGYF